MNIKILKKSVVIVLFFALLIQVYFWAEPISADSANDDVVVTLNVTSGITITDGLNVTMTPSMGVASNTSIGESSWVVKTNSVTGYRLDVKASTSPALKHSNSTDSFADYSETSTGTPETWSVSSGDYEFGYSVHGDDVDSSTWGTGTSCGTSSTISTNNLKYVGFKTVDKTVATTNQITPVGGTQTNICFAAEQAGVYAPSGTYTATITATAVTI